jgi:hypothetical protein
MHKAQLRHASLADTIRECSSSPCWMHEVDPGYFGYWSREEIAAFLRSLLERERIGTTMFADVGRAADPGLALAVEAAKSHQAELIHAIEDAVLNILDSGLNRQLMRILQLHRKQVMQLETLLR